MEGQYSCMALVRFDDGTRVSERWDQVFRAVSAEPRRQVIGSLLDAPADEAVLLPESADSDHVQKSPEELRIDLYHRHLPLLADLGFIEWETDPLVAVRGPRFDEVAAVFEVLSSSATELPESLIVGCRRLERARDRGSGE